MDKFSNFDNRARACLPEGVKLTISREKLHWYGFDPYFRDGCDDVRALGKRGRTVDLWNNSFLVFRPDALVTRGVSRGIDVLLANDFSILKMYEFRYSYLSVREAWRYQHNINTTERLTAMDLLMTSASSLLCLVRSPCRPDDLPASSRLKILKGSSTPENRRPGQLRYDMGGTQASMLTFVHAPDEPADLLRELPIFLDPARRRDAYATLADEPKPMSREEIESIVGDVYLRTPAHDLRAASVLELLQQRGRVPASLLGDIERGLPLALDQTLEQLRMDPSFSQLDAVAIAARIGQGHIAGLTPVLPDVDPFAWKQLTPLQAAEILPEPSAVQHAP